MPLEQYGFSDDFQDLILACLIRNPERFYKFGEIVKPEFFNGSAAVEIVFRLKEYVGKYGKYPNFTVLGNYAFTRLDNKNPERAKDLLDYVQKIARVDTGDIDAVYDLCLKFAKERAVYDALRKIHLAQQEGKEGTVDPVQLMEQALSLGFNTDDLGLELHRDVETIIEQVSDINYGIRTGINEFDKLWKTGWPAGRLITLLAPPKSFKTTLSLNLALSIASQESNDGDVIYYACEIEQVEAALRTIYNLTGLTENDLWEGKEKFKEKARQTVDDRAWSGQFWFKGFPSKTATISNLKSHTKMLMRTYGVRPKAIFVDYAETVKPSNTKNVPDHRQQADIYTEARAFGADVGACIIMPDRCNKETVGQKVPSMKSFQGSFEKGGVVDAAIGICATDSEYKQNVIRLFVFLNRHGPHNKHYRGTVDAARYRIVINEEIEYNPDEEDEEPARPARGRQRSSGGMSSTRNPVKPKINGDLEDYAGDPTAGQYDP